MCAQGNIYFFIYFWCSRIVRMCKNMIWYINVLCDCATSVSPQKHYGHLAAILIIKLKTLFRRRIIKYHISERIFFFKFQVLFMNKFMDLLYSISLNLSGGVC
jgi:hypothetical protein